MILINSKTKNMDLILSLRDKNFQNFQSQYDTALENLDAKNREAKRL